jgi:hypothetical protein
MEEKSRIFMLYDSTKSLLQSILISLETSDETKWDDHTESGNACLYEMHQMSGRLYKAYKSDRLNAKSAVQDTLPEKLNRAMPHARMMVIAILHKDQARALESGKAAMAEMNGVSRPAPPVSEPRAEIEGVPIPVREHVKTSRQSRVASGK